MRVPSTLLVLSVTACGAPPSPPAKPPAVVATAGSATSTPSGPALQLTAMRPPPPSQAAPAPLLGLMQAELTRSLAALHGHDDPPYFASYEVVDATRVDVSASDGALTHSATSHNRWLDIDVRVGDYTLDNTHHSKQRSTYGAPLPVTDDAYAITSTLWQHTDAAYQHAAEALAKARANAKVMASDDDTSDDFSHEAPLTSIEPPAQLSLDRAPWEPRLRALSAAFRAHPEILQSSITLSAEAETRSYVASDGSLAQLPHVHYRVMIAASTRVDDGMDLHRDELFDVATPDRLPTDDAIRARVDKVIADLDALRAAPVADPYSGPAILEGQAASVFFHEVFGHRIEGHRQKDDSEGQTFSKKVGQKIMPDFLDVYDDPSIAQLDGVDLNGFYRVDDEGVAGQRASLVEHGVLQTFLLGRSPTRGFQHSNGHGRRSPTHSPVARQGNLVVAASRTVDRATLQRMLIDQVIAQNKPYGLIFRELDGGFTMTERFAPQSFKLLPIMVLRVYRDGHEELVRGADLEGTPLTALGDIVAAGDQAQTFNGYCGAESGFVPVSSTAPPLLVSHVEVAKKAQGRNRPPILPPPAAGGAR
jgi:predicted Zn-dependent protease|nr:TldD/PmbA family protein [Kofleriaceae bacterium]